MDSMVARTHLGVDPRLCGTATEMGEGWARVEMETVSEMGVDERGLVHGGFVFGMADYAAMLAVNDPNVVLAAAEVRFLAPVKVGERLVAEGRVEVAAGRRREVQVEALREGEAVLRGTLTCFVLEHHVLERDAQAGGGR